MQSSFVIPVSFLPARHSKDSALGQPDQQHSPRLSYRSYPSGHPEALCFLRRLHWRQKQHAHSAEGRLGDVVD